MTNSNDKQKGSKQQAKNDRDNLPKQQINNDTDTAPDEFIGPNADTDQPIDGGVVNDAVLRGENKPEQNESEPAKMDADKK